MPAQMKMLRDLETALVENSRQVQRRPEGNRPSHAPLTHVSSSNT